MARLGDIPAEWGVIAADPPRALGAHYHRAEIYFGEFKRVIELPWSADENRVDAKYREGMLEIHLVPAPQGRVAEIPIQQNSG